MDNRIIVNEGDVIYDPKDGEMWVVLKKEENHFNAKIINNVRQVKTPVSINNKGVPHPPWEKISSGTKLIKLLYT